MIVMSSSSCMEMIIETATLGFSLMGTAYEQR
jgi:hypothetical protein